MLRSSVPLWRHPPTLSLQFTLSCHQSTILASRVNGPEIRVQIPFTKAPNVNALTKEELVLAFKRGKERMQNRTVARFFLSKKNTHYLLKVFSVNLVVLGIFIIQSTTYKHATIKLQWPSDFQVVWLVMFVPEYFEQKDPFEGAMYQVERPNPIMLCMQPPQRQNCLILCPHKRPPEICGLLKT